MTHLLNAYGEGDREALDRLMPVVYELEVSSITIIPRPSATMGEQCEPLTMVRQFRAPTLQREDL